MEYHHVDGEGLLDANEVCGGMGGGYQGEEILGNGRMAERGRGGHGGNELVLVNEILRLRCATLRMTCG